MSSLQSLKTDYNSKIAKIYQAEKWIEENMQAVTDNHLQKFTKALDGLQDTQEGIEKQIGRKLTSEEVLNGFS